MARLVGAFAASHGPVIARDWEKLADDRRQRLADALDELGRRLRAARPDVLVVISPDHWVNFFIDNLPSVLIGVGEEHEGPPEPFMKAVYPHRTLAGHPTFGRHLLDTAMANDFEPSLSYRLTLDHGVCVPLWRMAIGPELPIVPILVNGIEAPMPSIRRCLSWGRLVRKAIESYPGDEGVAILATGGLSHSIGEPTMGWVDEPFDRECVRLFEAGDEKPLSEFLERALPDTGNGGHEVRNWCMAHAAAGSTGFELVDYIPSPETLVGVGFASWAVGTR